MGASLTVCMHACLCEGGCDSQSVDLFVVCCVCVWMDVSECVCV